MLKLSGVISIKRREILHEIAGSQKYLMTIILVLPVWPDRLVRSPERVSGGRRVSTSVEGDQ